MLQNATLLRKSPPGSPNTSNTCVSCTASATRHASLQILFKCPTPAMVFETATKPSRFAHFCQGAQSTASKCASHHSSVNFFDTSTSKSGPELVCFVHFDLDMCFAPQRRNFSSLIWPAGSAPAALASLLFDPPEPQIKNIVFRNFATISRACIFFLLTLSLL